MQGFGGVFFEYSGFGVEFWALNFGLQKGKTDIYGVGIGVLRADWKDSRYSVDSGTRERYFRLNMELIIKLIHKK